MKHLLQVLVVASLSLMMAVGCAPQQEDLEAKSYSHLAMLGLCTMKYAVAHQEKFPDLSSPSAAKVALLPYANQEKWDDGTPVGETVFANPETGEAYQPNPKMSGKTMGLADPDKAVLFWESKPYADGTRGIVFADGHRAKIKESEWEALKDKPVVDTLIP